ncbi:MAG: glycosyltransferase family 4 protein, partial [Patescibacteria group bacterium]
WPLFKRGFTKASIVQVISTFLGRWARRRNFTGPLEVIPNGVDTGKFAKNYPQADIDEIKTKLGKRMGDVFLITTSRLVHKNAVDDVIKAMSLIPRNVRFIVGGIGPDEEKLKKLALDTKVSDRVEFLGQLSHQDMPLYLKASDIFIRPSRSEGMGNSFVEAMAAGLPVIATQEGGIADFLFDRKRNPDKPTTGWAVSKDSPGEIAEGVKDIMDNPERTHAVAATAWALVMEKYGWDLIANDMKEKVFDRLFKV